MISAQAAAMRDADRLRQCGLVYHERQIDSSKWIGPPGGCPDGTAKVKTLPLNHVEPKPIMLVFAHGETYRIPHDFRGGWFDVVSPTGKPLIA